LTKQSISENSDQTAYKQWISTGAVSANYLRDALGPFEESVSPHERPVEHSEEGASQETQSEPIEASPVIEER
jgi:hypothetical protein